jgi:uncharacterized Fe-S radical SAM superfamily protein PflX
MPNAVAQCSQEGQIMNFIARPCYTSILKMQQYEPTFAFILTNTPNT